MLASSGSIGAAGTDSLSLAPGGESLSSSERIFSKASCADEASIQVAATPADVGGERFGASPAIKDG